MNKTVLFITELFERRLVSSGFVHSTPLCIQRCRFIWLLSTGKIRA